MFILITGAGGQLGRKLIAKTRGTNYELRLLARAREYLPEFQDRVVLGDILDKASLKAVVQGVDTVIHLAGLTHTNQTKLYYQVNVLGTKNLIEVCREAGVKKFIFISSRTAGLTGGDYAKSKFLAEQEVKKSGLDWIILRLAEVYGAGLKEAISQLVKIIKISYVIPIIGRGQFKVSPIFIDDAIDGILATLSNSQLNNQTYILAGPEEFTYDQLVNKILQATGLKRIKLFLPLTFVKLFLSFLSFFKLKFFVKDQLPRLLSDKPSDIGPAIRDFNFQPRDFNQGLSELLNQD